MKEDLTQAEIEAAMEAYSALVLARRAIRLAIAAFVMAIVALAVATLR